MHLCISLFSNFGGARFQSHSLTQQKISTNITSYLKHGCQKFTQKHPLRMPLHALIVRDLHSLRYAVPSFPAFASSPCNVSITSPAHVSGVGCTISRTPTSVFHRIQLKQGLQYRYCSRFLVINPNLWLGRKTGFHCLAPIVAQRTQLRVLRFTAIKPRKLAFSLVGSLESWRLSI